MLVKSGSLAAPIIAKRINEFGLSSAQKSMGHVTVVMSVLMARGREGENNKTNKAQ